jgi:hypothetical protein
MMKKPIMIDLIKFYFYFEFLFKTLDTHFFLW